MKISPEAERLALVLTAVNLRPQAVLIDLAVAAAEPVVLAPMEVPQC